MASAFFTPRHSSSSSSGYDNSSNPYNPNAKESWDKDNPYESYKPRGALGGLKSENNSTTENKFAKYADWVKTLRSKTSQLNDTDTSDKVDLSSVKSPDFSMFGSQQSQHKSLFGNKGNYPKFKRYI